MSKLSPLSKELKKLRIDFDMDILEMSNRLGLVVGELEAIENGDLNILMETQAILMREFAPAPDDISLEVGSTEYDYAYFMRDNLLDAIMKSNTRVSFIMDDLTPNERRDVMDIRNNIINRLYKC